MKNPNINFVFLSLTLLSIIFLATNCQKEDLRAPYVAFIDPATEPDRLGRNLGILGAIIEGGIPTSTSINILSIIKSQTSAKVSKGSKLYVPFTYQSNQKTVGVYLQVVGANHFWQVPATIDPLSDSYVFSLEIPERVFEGDFNLNYAIYDEAGNISPLSSMRTSVANVEKACTGSDRYHEEGEDGLTVRRMELDEKAGPVNIEYEMYSKPDRMDIFYDGKWVASTDDQILSPNDSPPSSTCHDGTPGYVSGSKVLSFDYNPERSKEFFVYIYGCFGGTAWDFWVDCPSDQNIGCDGGSPDPSIFVADETLDFQLNATDPQIANLQVNQGDYIFISAKGLGAIGHELLGGIQLVSPDGDEDYNDDDLRKWTNFDAGQLVVNLNTRQYPCDNYTLKNRDCGNIPDEFTADNIAFFGEYGNYFVAESSGQLSFEINDLKLEDNFGKFQIEIYKLSKDQHQSRNCFNRCPATEPVKFDDYQARDHSNLLWKEQENLGWLIPGAVDDFLDEQLEACWHGGFDDYRGLATSVKGCQCIYTDSGALNNVASSFAGSYDYGYRFDTGDVRLHFILDVFPHIAYSIVDPGFIYNATPEENVY